MAQQLQDLETEEQGEFQRRKNRLFDCLLQKMTVEELVHEAALLMDYPVILTTSYYRVIAMDDLGKPVDDPIWRDAERTGYCSAEAVMQFEQQGVTKEVHANPKAILLDRGLAEQIPRILQQIRVFGKVGAYIGVFQVEKPFRRVDFLTTELLCGILSIRMEGTADVSRAGTRIQESILSDLLDGSLGSATLLNDRMRAAHWEAKPVFQCVLLTPPSRAAGIENAEYLSMTLQRMLPGAQTILVKEGVLLLLNFRSEGEQAGLLERLGQISRQSGLYLTLSDPFVDLIHLRTYYEACGKVCRLSRKAPDRQRICRFEDWAFSYLADSLTKEERRAFAQDKYRTLSAYDLQHGTELCRTLITYIECGCSVSATAAALYVHRNTVAKRLSRMTELCSLDLSDGKALIRFYLTLWFQ